MKAVLATISISIAFFAAPFVSFAQTATLTPPTARSTTLLKVYTQCTDNVSQRLTSLQKTSVRINGLSKLAQNYKTQYQGEISTDSSGLQTLQTQCTTDYNAGNIQALRTDDKNIFTQFRVYAVFLPQLWNLIASDTMTVTASKLSDLATKLQGRIQSNGSAQNLTSLLSDMQAKITDANTQYTNVEAQVTPLTPNSYNTDPTGTTAILTNARSEIKTGTTDLQTAWSDAKQIIQSLKGASTAPTSH